jgi:hypothetical protein
MWRILDRDDPGKCSLALGHRFVEHRLLSVRPPSSLSSFLGPQIRKLLPGQTIRESGSGLLEWE